MIVDQFDEMVEQCAAKPLVMTLSLHPFVVGQPFRLPSLRKALKHCVEHPKRDRVWWTTPGQVADFCYALPPGTIPGEGPKGASTRLASRRPAGLSSGQIRHPRRITWPNHCPSARSARAESTASAIGLGCMSFSGVYGPSRRRRGDRADPRGARCRHHHARFLRRLRQGPQRDAARQRDQGPARKASCSPPSSAISAAPAANTPTAGRSSS